MDARDGYAKVIPVIVMSASALPEDVNRAYELGANASMVKPTTYVALEPHGAGLRGAAKLPSVRCASHAVRIPVRQLL